MITTGTALAVAGAAIAIGVPGISTAIGVKAAGVTASGAVAEDRAHFKNSLVLQALPQTQTIYGFIIALFILIGAGLTGAPKDITPPQGMVMLASGIIVALTGISSVMQGLVASSGIVSCTKNKDAFIPSIVFTGQCETPAIFGFIVAVIILVLGLTIF